MPRKPKPLPPKPPATPFVRLTPPAGEAIKDRMLGESAGRIPAVLPKEWTPMIMVGDATRTVHAVPAGPRALCGYESGTGWLWGRGLDVTCQHCCRKIMEEELEKDSIVRSMRKYGVEVDRENYISFNWAGLSLKDWGCEHEEELPELLRDYSGTQWPWPNRMRRAAK